MAIIEKLTNEQAERENSGYLQLFKKKGTNKLMYLTKDGVEKVIIDQDLLDAELATLPTPPTTTVVNISSAQILAMGTTPIELLPAPGSGLYYDVDKITFEYTHVTTGYTVASNDVITITNCLNVDSGLLVSPSDKAYKTIGVDVYNASLLDPGVEIPYSSPTNAVGVNQAISMSVYSATDPTLGNGTMRAIITYTTRTFGA